MKLLDVCVLSNWGNWCIIVDNIYDRLICVLICICLCIFLNEFVNIIFWNIILIDKSKVKFKMFFMFKILIRIKFVWKIEYICIVCYVCRDMNYLCII